METRFTQKIEIRSVGEKPKICGYASVFNSLSEPLGDGFREIILPGAFTKSLKNDIRLLWDHERKYVLGRTKSNTLEIREDGYGLFFECTPPNTTWAKDLMESIGRQDVSGCSFGFNMPDPQNDQKWSKTKDGIVRNIANLDLREITITSLPAYPQTSVSLRSLGEEYEITNNGIPELYGQSPDGSLVKINTDREGVKLENINLRYEMMKIRTRLNK